MDRELRNFCWFVLGVVLVAVPMLSFAGTYPATKVWTSSFGSACVSPNWCSSPSDACTKMGAAYTPPVSLVPAAGESGYCKNSQTGSEAAWAYYSPTYKCLNGGTLAGQTCTKTCAAGEELVPNGLCAGPCPSGQERDPVTGVCESPKCKLAANAQIGTGNYQFPRPQPSGVTWCINNCSAYQGVEAWHTPTVTYAPAYVNGAGGDASTCQSSGSNTPVPTQDEPTKADPPCSAGQGTATMGGKVICVDTSQVPTAEAPPDVKKTTTTKTEADGSTTTITEIRTCTGEGACSTTTTTTIGAKPSGAPGTAGTPGTSTGTKNTESSETADFCKSNPNMQICKGGMATETTLAETRDEIKKLTKSDELSDEAITGKSTFNSGDNAALKAQNEDLIGRVSGTVVPDGVQGNKSAWEAAMSGGWFEEIPNTGCSPAIISAGGRSITLDWCARAEQISQMGAYALWFTLLVGVFVMLTGGKRGD